MMRSRPMTGMEIMKDGIGNASGRRSELPIEQGQWANLPPELLSEIIERVEESETSWPCWDVMSCAAVCKPWWRIIKETFSSPEKCGRLILPISVKQPGPRDHPIHCFVRRDTRTSAYGLYYGLVPSKHESDKLLLSATRIRSVTTTDFVISLPSDVLSRPDDNTYVGKLRSNFTGRKFTIYESSSRFDKKPDSKQPPARKSHCKYTVGTVSYSVARNRPRRMNCVMNSIPASFSVSKGKDLAYSNFSTANLSAIKLVQVSGDPLVLMNKAPWWHEKHRFWCLNFRGRVTVASVKNFQLLLAADQPSGNVSSAQGEKVILQFGKIGGDTFTMDYRYPLSAFQAFAICLSSFGSNAYY